MLKFSCDCLHVLIQMGNKVISSEQEKKVLRSDEREDCVK